MGVRAKFWTVAAVVAAATTTGCARQGSPPSGFEAASPSGSSESSALMLRHFDHARSLSSAAIFGRPERAHAAAVAMRDEGGVVGMPSDARDEYDAFLASVRAVERSEGRDELAASAAEVAQRCGDCHLASGLGPTFTVGKLEDPVTPRDHIRVLAWGSSRMWESLIGGSDLAWRAGARALSGQPLREELYAARISDVEAGRRLSARLHELGVEALSASDPAQRADLLGDVWATCAACHELVGLAR